MPEPIILVQQPGDEAIEAIAAYGHRQARWRLMVFSDNSLPREPELLAAASAVIASTRSAATIHLLRASGLPWINLRYAAPGGAQVTCDQRAIGRLAAEHLAGLGVTGIAYYGPLDAHLVHGLHAVCAQRLPSETILGQGRLITWLRGCAKPWGLFCSSDGKAVEAINAVRDAGFQVPEDLAICGVNNNRAQALCAAVPLTSIDLNITGMASTAARLLDAHLTRGRRLPPLTLVPPGPLVQRRSTATQHGLTQTLATALRLMEARYADGIRLDIVLRACACSRSSLERQFQARFGLSPGAWLHQRRLREARRLIEEGGHSTATIAARCGLGSASYLARVFRQHFGCPPSQWVGSRVTP